MPDKTLDYFTKISSIPRPSGMEKGVMEFLVEFAKSHNLQYFTDSTYNVIIKKPSNRPKCDKTLILQAHTDMVCEKNGDVDFDFLTQGINLKTEGDFLMANGTTLGADNGIGLSMILSILDDDNLDIPNLECLFTAQEETTMQGANDADFSKLKGNCLLSIDGTDEARIEVSSAGMKVLKYSRKFTTTPLNSDSSIYKLKLSGLRGGHSGSEINTNRKNAIKLLFELVKSYKDVKIISLTGGGKANAIPRECECVFSCDRAISELQTITKNFNLTYKAIEPDFMVKLENVDLTNANFISKSGELIEFINSHKNGVLEYDKENTTFPLISNNLANIKLTEGVVDVIVSIRSSVAKLEEQYINELNSNAESFGFKNELLTSAPFFERKENSYLQGLCKTSYESLFDKEAIIEGIHAGLEGGVFASKKKGLDICVIAPNIFDAHSPKERVSLSSIFRVYKWIEKIVKDF